MKKNISRNNINPWLFVYLIVFSSIFIITLIYPPPTSINVICDLWGLIILAQFISFLVLFYQKYKTINNPYLYFIYGSFVCWFGQIIVAMINLFTTNPQIIESFSPYLFYTTLQYTFLCFFVLCNVGLILIKKKSYKNFIDKFHNLNLKKSINTTAILMMLIGIYPYFSAKYAGLNSSIQNGYSSIFNQGSANINETSSLFSSLSIIFIPSLLIILVINKKNRTIKFITAVVIAISIFMSLNTGGRAEVISILAGAFWIYSNEFKKISKLKIVIFLPIALLLTKVFSTLATFRSSSNRTFNNFMNLFFIPNKQNFITGTLSEFGFNIFSVYHTIDLIPKIKNYSYGFTYLASVMALVPRFFYGGYSFSASSALPDWLKNVLGLNYGPGYTIVAESYYNFGWFGFLAIFTLGLILVKILSNKFIDSDYKSLQNAFIAIVLYDALFMARSTSLLLLRQLFYTVFVPLILIRIFYGTYYNRKNGKTIHEES